MAPRRSFSDRRTRVEDGAVQLSLMIEGQEGVSWDQWLALATACERHGIESLFRSDHYLNLGEHPERGSLDAWATLSALAAHTTTLRLGTLVSPATFRHPSELAKVVATVDHVSGGRVELGIGAGWHEREHAAYGFRFPPVGTRMDVLTEQIQIVLGSWRSSLAAPFSFAGAHYALDAVAALPAPRQRPHPPLIVGGSGAPRSAALAGRYADEYNSPYITAAQLAETKPRIDAACVDAGRGPIPYSVMTCVVVGADETELADRTRRLEERAGYAPGSLRSDPPPAFVIGTVEQVADGLRAYARAGASRVMCQHLLHDDVEMVALLGEAVAPLVA